MALKYKEKKMDKYTRLAWNASNERNRQVYEECHSFDDDDACVHGELVHAAASYLHSAIEYGDPNKSSDPPSIWPWLKEDWKPTSAKRDLEKCLALLLAEEARISRAEARQQVDEYNSKHGVNYNGTNSDNNR